jgi:Lrp/AsnC family transcriptional regulator for asnA, asnC and gidA
VAPQKGVGGFRFSPADIEIIRCLNKDARSSVTKIAGRLAMPESTVRHRLNRLLDAGVIEFTAVPNPLQLGYRIWAILEIQAELSRIRGIARELADRPEVYFVGITTGSYDILAGAVFRSNDELLEFITGYLPKVPGIIRTSTSTVLDVVKRFLTFAVAGEGETAEPAPRRRRRAAATAARPLRKNG